MIRELKRKFNNRSTTLIECMISLVLLTIGLLSAYLAYAQSVRMVNSLWNTSRVNSAIRQEMELIRTWNWSTVSALNSTNFTNIVLNDVPDAVGIVDAEYYPVATNSSLTIRKITVRVDWTDMNGRSREDTATTLVSQNGLNTGTE